MGVGSDGYARPGTRLHAKLYDLAFSSETTRVHHVETKKLANVHPFRPSLVHPGNVVPLFLYLDYFFLLLRRREQFLEHLSRRCFCTPFMSPVRVVIFVAPSRFISLFVPSSHDVFERPVSLRARRGKLDALGRTTPAVPSRRLFPIDSFKTMVVEGRRPRRSCSLFFASVIGQKTQRECER